jgi:hypothetical protein
MKNGILWDMTPCGYCKNRRFGRTYLLDHQTGRPVTANLSSSLIISTPMIEAIRYSNTSLVTKATDDSIPRFCYFSCAGLPFYPEDGGSSF